MTKNFETSVNNKDMHVATVISVHKSLELYYLLRINENLNKNVKRNSAFETASGDTRIIGILSK